MSPAGSSMGAAGRAKVGRRFDRLWRHLQVLAATAAMGGFIGQAQATFPGENGVIVFNSGGSESIIGRVSPGSSTVTMLTQGYAPKVSPNGKKVAFLRGKYRDLKDVYVMNIDGSGVVKLTETPLATAVAWFSDGTRLAYTVAASTLAMADLWTMRADGTDKIRVRALTEALYGMDWSPSSDAFVFAGTGYVYVADMVNPLSNPIHPGHMPSWAPDGKKIVFGGSQGYQGLAEIRPDGTGYRVLPPDNTFTGTNAISPDGTLIAGGIASNGSQLATRAPAGVPTTFTWPTAVGNVDWGRVPKNCFASTPEGGGGVLADDVDAYADQCAIALVPEPVASGVLAQAVAVGSNGRVHARTLKANPSGGNPVWGPFTVIPGLSGNPDGVSAKKLAIAAARDGSFQVAITIAGDNTVAHALQYPNGTWSGFSRLDGFSGSPDFQARDVAIAINGSSASSAGNAQVIANGLVGGSVFHRVRWPAGNWTPFLQVPGAQTLDTQALAIASSDDLNTNLLVITTQGIVKQVLRDPDGNWGGWVNVGTPLGMQFNEASDVAITRTELAGNPAHVMLLDSKSRAYFQVRAHPNLAASWQGVVPTVRVTTDGRTVSISSAGSGSILLTTRVDPP